MAWNILPTNNNVGTHISIGDRVLSEFALLDWMNRRGASPLESFVYSGLGLSDGGGLNVNVATGVAIMFGAHARNDATATVATTNNATNYIYVQLTKSSSLITGATLVSTTSTTAPADSAFLGRVRTSGGAIVSIQSAKKPPHSPLKDSYTEPSTGIDQGRVHLGFRPRFVIVIRRTTPPSAADIFSLSGIDAATQIGAAIVGSTPVVSLPTSTNTRPLLQFDGFDVSGTAAGQLLVAGATYDYLAWC